jgi:hypothetical protein
VLLRYVISFTLVGSRKSNTGSQKSRTKAKEMIGGSIASAISPIPQTEDSTKESLDSDCAWSVVECLMNAPQVKSSHDAGDAVYKEQSCGGAACIIDASVFPYFQHSRATVAACGYRGVEC